MEQEDTLHKASLTDTEHDDFGDDEISSTAWDRNAADDMSNVRVKARI